MRVTDDQTSRLNGFGVAKTTLLC